MRKISSLIIIAYSAGIVYPAGACFMSCFGGRATCGCCIPQQIGPEPEIKAIQEKINEHDATLKVIKEKVFAAPINIGYGVVQKGTSYEYLPSESKAEFKARFSSVGELTGIQEEELKKKMGEKAYSKFYISLTEAIEKDKAKWFNS